jgi:hypothetical protein
LSPEQQQLERIEKMLEAISSLSARWLDLKAAAAYTSMSAKTLMKYIKRGEIYASHKDGKWYIDRESIDAFHLSDKVKVEETVARILRRS